MLEMLFFAAIFFVALFFVALSFYKNFTLSFEIRDCQGVIKPPCEGCVIYIHQVIYNLIYMIN